MDGESSHLPWEALHHTQGDIPWSALETFADAVTTDTDLTNALFDAYEQARDTALGQTCYADLYVSAIFALASPKLSDEQRGEIGTFLVEKLVEAGEDDDDLALEVVKAAAGSMGPVILPAVLDAIAEEPDTLGAWFHLWVLTGLAVEAHDDALRERVVQACVELLERADRDDAILNDAVEAAWTLGLLQATEHTELLRRLEQKSATGFMSGNYREALGLLEGRRDRVPLKEPWEMPVREWFEPRWRTARDWFTRRDSEDWEDEDAGAKRAEEVVARFMASAWATDLPDDLFEDAGFIAHTLLERAFIHEGVAPEGLDKRTLRAVLLDIFPRKITAERELFEKVAPVTEAFLDWMASEGILADVEPLTQAVRSWAEEIVTAGMDPQNWGMAKTFMMRAERAGVDTTDEAALLRYQLEQPLMSPKQDSERWPDSKPLQPAIPIVEHSPRTGRNDPCPCGSGKKYKKCCLAYKEQDK